ncbi:MULTISPECIES: FAD-binding and (Fe-S)-binding domain-containing protein [Colwellia]|uniref:D-lactate dehydrogenase (cytochrome) n=1 Tax=Colwellia marinimaniae TaxID=1513592 RepID=A0ABQ0MXQ5_9GAMM|nr:MULTISPECIES: FAD-binding and (Fe-S)-binding domain-containing protein [Colwellia]GAW97012.1 lactate dehydrogenase [Colwellia marinimaniae]
MASAKQTVAASAFIEFSQAVAKILPKDNVIERYLQRFAYGTDASFYRLVPKVVLQLDSDIQVRQVIKLANKYQVAITFRAAGTSLSGQAISDSVLIILSSLWQGIKILDQGEKISLQPGVIGAHANKALQVYARKIGPDPASINSCKIGGIAANNSSGMCCGVKDNSYHTLADIDLIFADGSQLNTADSQSRETFLQQNKSFTTRLMKIVDYVNADHALVTKIKHKYRLKNTTGYGLNALVDYSDVIDIISHLIIGSEGTLAFINNITFHTIEVLPHKSAGLFIFDNMDIACNLVLSLAQERVDAVEIMDARALNSVHGQLASIVNIDKPLNAESVALLIEISADTVEQLQVNEQQLLLHIKIVEKSIQAQKAFTIDKDEIEALWKIRKGMFPAVGSVRPKGTTVIIEDIALPLARLAEGVNDLQQLFKQFGYDEAIIFGHALAGNLHFVFTQTFASDKEISRYRDFMAKVTKMVAIDYQGSLKAEHGTGRNMAPFVEMEWGGDLYQVMKQIKTLFDPKGILNPGVIINDDSEAHLRHLKTMMATDDIIDTCIECGFCEPVCPSKDFTLTPRQRIALWRQKALLSQQISHANDSEKIALTAQLRALEKDYQFFAIDSCAATGLCGQQCPVGIDTGMFIKSLREKKNTGSKVKTFSAKVIADNFSAVSSIARLGLNTVATINHIAGNKFTKKSFKAVSTLSNNAIPLWFQAWPAGAKVIAEGEFNGQNHLLSAPVASNIETQVATPVATTKAANKVVYIPSCANRIFGCDEQAPDKRSLVAVVLSLCKKANITVIIPKGSGELCCGMPWQSKGLAQISQDKRQQFLAKVVTASEQGKWPVITDASPCALTLNQGEDSDNSATRLVIFEATEFIAKYVVDKLQINKSDECFMLHNSCSSEKMDQGRYLKQLAQLCSDNIVEPENISCCGFAGDKGFYLPELNKSALAPLKAQIPPGCQRGLSNSRTCEIGLTEHSGISYQSILYLLDQCSD